MKKAVVLLSGGIDSAVTLYIAKQTYECSTLIFDYGQKAVKEIDHAVRISKSAGCDETILKIDFPWKGSSLLDEGIDIPEDPGSRMIPEIPNTYVPGRNIIFLSYGVSFAEAIKAEAVFIGAHQLDYSNYPDCRGEFFEAFKSVIDTGTKRGVEKHPIQIITPILDQTKRDIVEKGTALGVPFEDTWSCYRGDETPCGECESCVFRRRAFEQAGIKDPGESIGLCENKDKF